MGVKIIVTVKQVPDTHNVGADAMKPDGTVNRGALPAIFNPEDLNALEEALLLKERLGGTVTCITMGPPKAVEVLRECLYRGADEVLLVSDRKFAGADTLATSYALKCAVERIGEYDLVICGRQAIDGDTAQVGPQLAEKLQINQISNVVSVVAADDTTLTALRETESGSQTVRSAYPVLLTVTDEANEPRVPSAKRVMAYKNIAVEKADDYDEAYLAGENGMRKMIKVWDAAAIGADPDQCGLAGSPTKVKGIESVVLAAHEAKQVPNTTEGITELVDELTREHIIG
ncbi:MAG: electron transfer flavoprotein subunit beta/FixA family protein [Planctomycetota bacterium]